MSKPNLKKIKVFTGDGCQNCDILKPQLKLRKDLDIVYYDLGEHGRAFRDNGVMGIPTVFETYNGAEVPETRQTGLIDLTKY